MKKVLMILLAIGAATMLIGCGPSGLDITPQMEAARSAVDQAKTENAPVLCPEEFQSAEMKLKQMELMAADEENDSAQLAAAECVNLANMARNCAIARKQHTDSGPAVVGPPDALKNFKLSVYFDFNSNSISSKERVKLDSAIELLKKMSKDYKFYVMLSAYCDPPGTSEDNLDLSRRRALVVRYYMLQNGIMGNRIFMRAAGREAAVAALGEGDTQSTRLQKNPEWRRVEITVSFDRPSNVIIGDEDR